VCYTDLQESEQSTDVCTAAGRLRKICPVEDCDARVVHLPRHHRLNGSSSPVLTATSLSYGKAKNSTPHRIKTPDPIKIEFGTVD